MATAIVGLLAEWVAVTPGQWAYQDLFKDRDYEFIPLEAHATIPAVGETPARPSADFDEVVEAVELIYDNEVVRALTPAQIKQMNGRHGATFNATSAHVRTLNFREDHLWNREESDAMLLFAAYAKVLRIRVKLRSGIVDPVISGRYSAKPLRAVEPGYNILRKTALDNFDFSGAGTRKFRNVTPRGLVKCFTLNSDKVTGAKVTINGQVLKEFKSVAAMNEHLEANEMIPAAGQFVIPFDEDQEVAAGLDASTVQEIELEITVSGAGVVPMVQEYYEPLNKAV